MKQVTCFVILAWSLVACTVPKKNGSANEISAHPAAQAPISNSSGLMEPLALPSGVALPSPQVWPVTGLAQSPQPTSDPQRILLLIGGRKDHKQNQIYEMELRSGWMRRVTFQHGDITSLADTGDGWLYSSTSDEMKETLNLRDFVTGQKSQTQESPEATGLSKTEIYFTRKDGTHTRRLTRHPGFDGEISWQSKSGRFFYVTADANSETRVVELQVGGGLPRAVPGITPGLRRPVWSPTTKQLAGLLPNQDKSLVVVQKLGQRPETLPLPSALWDRASWSPDGRTLLLSTYGPSSDSAEIYSYNLEKSCLRRLTYTPGSDFDPIFTQNGTKVLWVHRNPKESSIREMDFIEPGSCETFVP